LWNSTVSRSNPKDRRLPSQTVLQQSSEALPFVEGFIALEYCFAFAFVAAQLSALSFAEVYR
jgi:hypothetical protein